MGLLYRCFTSRWLYHLSSINPDCATPGSGARQSSCAEWIQHCRLLLGSDVSPSTGAIHLTPGYGLLIDDPEDTARSPSPEDDDAVEMESPRATDEAFSFSPASTGFSFDREVDEELFDRYLATPPTRGYGAEQGASPVGDAIDLGDGTPAAVHFGGFGSPQGAEPRLHCFDYTWITPQCADLSIGVGQAQTAMAHNYMPNAVTASSAHVVLGVR